MWRCQHRAIFLWHLDRSCASLHTHIYLFFLFQSSVGEADVLLTGKIICSGGERKKKRKGGGRGGGEGKNIWICKSCHSVEPCNEWEMLLPSFIMQRSLLNARQLGPDSSLWAPPPHPHHHHHHYHHFCCHLIATWTKLQPGNTVHKKHTNARKALTNATGTRHLDVSIAIRKPKRKPCVVQFPD